MKKIIFNSYIMLTGFLFIAASFASCKKLIEIPPPASAITQQEQFADSLTTLSAVAGIYTLNNGNGFAYSSELFTSLPALSADELTYVTVSDIQQFYNYSITPLNTVVPTLWSNTYRGIYQVNKVLEGVAASNGLSATFQKQITGEMKVVRALYYFSLVNFFGEVPLITSSDYNTTAHLPKSSVDAVYSQIMADLADARKKLSPTYPSAGRTRPNLYTAIALQAKVDLYRGNLQNAIDEASLVIDSSGCSLVETGLDKVFLDGSTEAIWQIPGAQAFGVGVPDAAAFVPYSDDTPPNYLITPFLLDAFEPGDLRRAKWIGTSVKMVNNVPQTSYYPFKYKNPQSSTMPAEDQMVLRLAEMFLIRAEARIRLGNIPQGIDDLNRLRARARPATTPGQPDLLPDLDRNMEPDKAIKALMKERQTELFCEWGNRWFDLKRNVSEDLTAEKVLEAEKTGFVSTARLYPIPEAERRLNTSLIQNDGYN